MNLTTKEMERKKHLSMRPMTASSAILLAAAAAWDIARLMGAAAAPMVSHTLVAFAVAIGCTAVLVRALSRGPTRMRNAVELLILGIVLLSWWLRGDPGIPADPPLVVAELLGALVLAGSALFVRRLPVG
jgi:hypothetical protein